MASTARRSRNRSYSDIPGVQGPGKVHLWNLYIMDKLEANEQTSLSPPSYSSLLEGAGPVHGAILLIAPTRVQVHSLHLALLLREEARRVLFCLQLHYA